MVWPVHEQDPQWNAGEYFSPGCRLLRAHELEQGMGFLRDYTKLDDDGFNSLSYREQYALRRNSVGNSFAAPTIQRILLSILHTASRGAISCGASSVPYPLDTGWRRCKHPHFLDSIRPAAFALAEKLRLRRDFEDNTCPFVP